MVRSRNRITYPFSLPSTVIPSLKPPSPPKVATDVRSTHAAVDGHNSHLVLAWMTATATTLGPSDLFPAPLPHLVLAARRHIIAPVGAAQQDGCLDGQSAVSCVAFLSVGTGLVVPATGTDLSNFSLWNIYEPLSSGAYFLGLLLCELSVASSSSFILKFSRRSHQVCARLASAF